MLEATCLQCCNEWVKVISSKAAAHLLTPPQLGMGLRVQCNVMRFRLVCQPCNQAETAPQLSTASLQVPALDMPLGGMQDSLCP